MFQMFQFVQYSLFIFITIAVILSAVFKEEIKKHEKKHIVAAMFMALAIFIHAVVIVVRESVM